MWSLATVGGINILSRCAARPPPTSPDAERRTHFNHTPQGRRARMSLHKDHRQKDFRHAIAYRGLGSTKLQGQSIDGQRGERTYTCQEHEKKLVRNYRLTRQQTRSRASSQSTSHFACAENLYSREKGTTGPTSIHIDHG